MREALVVRRETYVPAPPSVVLPGTAALGKDGLALSISLHSRRRPDLSLESLIVGMRGSIYFYGEIKR
jgi:hypothetical protein